AGGGGGAGARGADRRRRDRDQAPAGASPRRPRRRRLRPNATAADGAARDRRGLTRYFGGSEAAYLVPRSTHVPSVSSSATSVVSTRSQPAIWRPRISIGSAGVV